MARRNLAVERLKEAFIERIEALIAELAREALQDLRRAISEPELKPSKPRTPRSRKVARGRKRPPRVPRAPDARSDRIPPPREGPPAPPPAHQAPEPPGDVAVAEASAGGQPAGEGGRPGEQDDGGSAESPVPPQRDEEPSEPEPESAAVEPGLEAEEPRRAELGVDAEPHERPPGLESPGVLDPPESRHDDEDDDDTDFSEFCDEAGGGVGGGELAGGEPADRKEPPVHLAVVRAPGAGRDPRQLDEEVDDEDEDEGYEDVASAAVIKLRSEALRPKARGGFRARTIPAKPLSRDERRSALLVLYPDVDRPRVRGECLDDERPCPFVSCVHHLYLDVNTETGAIKLNFPEKEVWELKETCSLDVADRGGITLEVTGDILNLTRERIRQVEVRTLDKIRKQGDYEVFSDLLTSGKAAANEY